MKLRSQPFFLETAASKRFCILHEPDVSHRVSGTIVYIHPFAEEMNKCRRVAALASRALACHGWAVLQIDLAGCGDSDGDFSEATWTLWLEDVAAAQSWLASRFAAPRWLWGLRAGCLLAADAARTLAETPNLLLWQPVLSGKLHLTQFLRLKLAGQMLEGTEARSTTQSLRGELAAGRQMEVAGYVLSAQLAKEMERADLSLPDHLGKVLWCEVSSAVEAVASPASQSKIDSLAKQGVSVANCVVQGPAFWQTAEIAECPALVAATIDMLSGIPLSPGPSPKKGRGQ